MNEKQQPSGYSQAINKNTPVTDIVTSDAILSKINSVLSTSSDAVQRIRKT